jgi:hypothetical protein
LWAAQTGWNSATPKGWHCTQGKMAEKSGEAVDVELSAGQYLADVLTDLGFVARDGMGGEHALDWPVLWAYGQATGAVAEPWEYTALRDMSRAYLTGRIEGADPLSMPPAKRGS